MSVSSVFEEEGDPLDTAGAAGAVCALAAVQVTATRAAPSRLNAASRVLDSLGQRGP